MTLTQQFPDVSMLIRDKRKLNLKYNAAKLFKDIHYNPITADQKAYDKEFKKWHYKFIAGLSLMFVALTCLLLNARTILNWLLF